MEYKKDHPDNEKIKDNSDNEKEKNIIFKNYKKTNKKIFEKLLDKNEHYYYIDNNNNEWRFTEINGTEKFYHFKCSTTKCKGFGKIERKGNKSIFFLTKEHTIAYTEHTYYKNVITPENIKKDIISNNDWKDKNFRIKFFKNYFENNIYCSIQQCFEYTRGKLGENTILNDSIKQEIQTAKTSVNITQKNKEDIIDLINSLKDNDNNPISYNYQYEILNNKTKKNEKYNIWLIMTKEMNKKLKNNKSSQFFCDTTYRCIPPTFKSYKLFIISSYDFNEKKIFICTYALIPNEKEKIYEFIFETLKKDFSFNPYIITLDYSKSISGALTKIFEGCIQVK